MSREAVFNSFLSDESKQDAEKTSAHNKNIMELLQKVKVLMTKKSTIREDKYGCAEQIRCSTELYLLSMLSHTYKILIHCVVEAPEHGIVFVDGLNATEKRFLTVLMTTVKLPGADTNYSQTVIHTAMSNTDISLARVLQIFSDPTGAHGLIDHGK